MATLEVVLEELNTYAELQTEATLENMTELQGIKDVLLSIRSLVRYITFQNDLLLSQKGMEGLENLERERESGGETLEKTDKPEKVDGIGGGLGIMAAIAGSLAGFAIGLGDAINDALKVFRIDLAKFFMLGKLKEVAKSGGNIFSSASENLRDLVKTLKVSFLDKLKSLTDNRFFRFIGSFFSGFKNWFVGVGEDLNKLKNIIGFGGQGGGFFKKIIEGITSTFSKFFGIFRVFGRLLGPIAAIVEVGMSVFSEIDDLEEGAGLMEKFGAVVRGVIKGLGNFFIGVIDLIKDGFSWLMEKAFGEDNPVSNFLDSFDLTDLFSRFVDFISNLIGKVREFFSVKGVKNLIKSAGGAVSDFFENFFDGDDEAPVPPTPAPAPSSSGPYKVSFVEAKSQRIAMENFAPQKASLPEGVTVDSVSGKYRSRNKKLGMTRLFASPEQAGEFVNAGLSRVAEMAPELSQQVAEKQALQAKMDANLAELTIQPVPSRSMQTQELASVTTMNQETKSIASSPTVIAPSTSNVNNSTNVNQTVTMPMPSTNDNSDRYAPLFGAR